MESELSGIFRVKLVTKNIVHGSPGTQFMHMRAIGKIIGNGGYCHGSSPVQGNIDAFCWGKIGNIDATEHC